MPLEERMRERESRIKNIPPQRRFSQQPKDLAPSAKEPGLPAAEKRGKG
jgi:hypothetical protein